MRRLLAGITAASLISVALACSSATPTPPVAPVSPPETTVVSREATPVTSSDSTTEAARVTSEAFFLEVLGPGDESVAREPSVEVTGNTTVDAVVTVNDQVAEVDEAGRFATQLSLEEGPNVIEIISSDFSGNQEVRVLTLIYVP